MSETDSNKVMIDGILYWRDMEDFYADSKAYADDRGPHSTSGFNDNRDRIQFALNMIYIDLSAMPLPQEKPDMLRLFRIWVRGYGDLEYAPSVIEIREEINNERLLSFMIDNVLRPETPVEALVCADCGEHECVCVTLVDGGFGPRDYDANPAEFDEEARFERYLNTDLDQTYYPPNWAEGCW